MGLMDILEKYENRATAPDPATVQSHYDQVAAQAPPEVLGQGLGDAFRADSTPSFGDMVGQMFGKSDPQQRAGVLNNLLRSAGPGLASVLGGGLLGRLAGQGSGAAPQVTPQEASQVTPDQVKVIANHAEQHDPSILDKVGGFYAQHPQLVKTLGSAAVAIALAGVSNRMRGRV